MMDGPVISIRTLKPIKKNEEIFISYIDTTNPYPRRQSELKSRWFFTCRCSKCQKGPVLVEDKWAIQPSQVDENWKEMADQFMKNEGEEGTTDPANYTGDSLDQKRVAALQSRIFTLYQTAQTTTDPASAIKIIEDGMRICHQSELWPGYRQPYAALRDELIVNLLEVGDYQGAWRQCAKRYRDVLPELYEQAFHPVRVVLVWQSAMLAWWVLGEGGVEGVDFGMVCTSATLAS
jgi:SET and MYND domain-containing protein